MFHVFVFTYPSPQTRILRPALLHLAGGDRSFDMFHVFTELSLSWPSIWTQKNSEPLRDLEEIRSSLLAFIWTQKKFEPLYTPLQGLRRISSSSVGLYRDLEKIQDSSPLYGRRRILSSSIGLHMDLVEIRAPLYASIGTQKNFELLYRPL